VPFPVVVQASLRLRSGPGAPSLTFCVKGGIPRLPLAWVFRARDSHSCAERTERATAGAKAQFHSKTRNAALEGPLFHGRACVRDLHAVRAPSIRLSFRRPLRLPSFPRVAQGRLYGTRRFPSIGVPGVETPRYLLSPLRGCSLLGGLTHGLRRGLHSFAALRLGRLGG
jgi:hypothetical protein